MQRSQWVFSISHVSCMKTFVLFVVAAVVASVSAIPVRCLFPSPAPLFFTVLHKVPGGLDLVPGFNAFADKGIVADFPVRGRSPARILARDPRHGGDSGSRGRSGSRTRRDVCTILYYLPLTLTHLWR